MPKVILISGGSDGLGKEIAKQVFPGNQVIVLAHNPEKLTAVAKEINCDYVVGEMTDYNSLKSAVGQVISKYQKIDVLVNNAGVWTEGQLDDTDPAKIKEVIDINTTGTIFLTRIVLPYFRAQKSGQIINIVSQDGLYPKKIHSVYSASKWAITGFTRCLQEDLADSGIKVTAFYPGMMKTGLFKKDNVNRDVTEALDPAKVASLVSYVINLNQDTHIPEVSIKNKNETVKTMDDTNAPAIDLNIDPDLITPQGGMPQATPPAPVTSPNTIDITPGSQTVVPTNPDPTTSHLSDLLPKPEPEPIVETTAPAAAVVEPAPVIPNTPETNVVATPITPPEPISTSTPVLPQEPAPVNTDPATVQPSANPLFEDPDLVKLSK